jgi:hypothetical protein
MSGSHGHKDTIIHHNCAVAHGHKDTIIHHICAVALDLATKFTRTSNSPGILFVYLFTFMFVRLIFIYLVFCFYLFIYLLFLYLSISLFIYELNCRSIYAFFCRQWVELLTPAPRACGSGIRLDWAPSHTRIYSFLTLTTLITLTILINNPNYPNNPEQPNSCVLAGASPSCPTASPTYLSIRRCGTHTNTK